MEDQILYDDNGKKIIVSRGRPIKDLRLDALVIPAFPDLFIQYSHEYMGEIFSQQGEHDIQDLGNDVAIEYAARHGSTEKNGVPFLVPSRSVHVVQRYQGDLAGNLIYVASIDLDDEGNPICNEGVIRDSTRAVLEIADLYGFSRIGIPAIGSSNLYNNPLELRVNAVASECYEHLKDKFLGVDTVYILISDGAPADVELIHPYKLN